MPPRNVDRLAKLRVAAGSLATLAREQFDRSVVRYRADAMAAGLPAQAVTLQNNEYLRNEPSDVGPQFEFSCLVVPHTKVIAALSGAMAANLDDPSVRLPADPDPPAEVVLKEFRDAERKLEQFEMLGMGIRTNLDRGAPAYRQSWQPILENAGRAALGEVMKADGSLVQATTGLEATLVVVTSVRALS